jgi:hypothetical protein
MTLALAASGLADLPAFLSLITGPYVSRKNGIPISAVNPEMTVGFDGDQGLRTRIQFTRVCTYLR